MTRLRIALLLLSTFLILSDSLQAQTQEELQELKITKIGQVEDYKALIVTLENELAVIESQMDLLSGWRYGLTGVFGFDWDRSWTWISNPNPNSRSSSLNIGLVGTVKNDQEKTFWYNSATLQKAWKRFDPNTKDNIGNEGLFKNGTVDLLNISSLAGYKLRENLAISALAELYSSLEKLTKQGTIDFGVGVTWLPFSNLTVTVNPLNYHYVYSNLTGLTSEGALGAKLRAEYLLNFKMFANNCSWQSTLTSFMPYGSTGGEVPSTIDPTVILYNSSLFEYTWLNTLTLELWKGIGVGLGWGLRKSNFEALADETPALQSYMNFGVSYGF